MYDRKAYAWEIARWTVRVIGAHEAPVSSSITAKRRRGGIEE